MTIFVWTKEQNGINSGGLVSERHVVKNLLCALTACAGCGSVGTHYTESTNPLQLLSPGNVLASQGIPLIAMEG